MQQRLVSTASPSIQGAKPAIFYRSLKLMKPVTWFGPSWAFLCGAVASGATGWNLPDIGHMMLGILLAGPVLCGASQIVNDYFDRDVDALNEPQRLIPSGLVSMRQLVITIGALLAIGVSIGVYMGREVALFSAIGLVLALFYSAPPVRAKRNGWIGNTLVAISYEGLAWMAGHAAFAPLTMASVLIAGFYSLGAHGIMSINDYKSIEGDRVSGIRTIPLLYGPERAARLIVFTMNLAQIGVIIAFMYWESWFIALGIAVILLIQLPLQRSFLRQPVENHLKFSAIGVSFFVWGMMVAAVGLRSL